MTRLIIDGAGPVLVLVLIGVVCELAMRAWDRLTLPQHRRDMARRRHPSHPNNSNPRSTP